MNTNQFDQTALQNQSAQGKSVNRNQTPDRRWLPYGIGLLILIGILCLSTFFACNIPIISDILPFCPEPDPGALDTPTVESPTVESPTVESPAAENPTTEAPPTAPPTITNINFLKEVSTTATGPWGKSITVREGDVIYYRFIIENLAEVPFSSVSITDPNVSTAGCTWPASLPVAVSGSEDHVAWCVVGPFTAVPGVHTNTATAFGANGEFTFTSNPSSATYEVQPPTSINLYLPVLSEDQQGFSSQIQGQLDEFLGANEEVTITVNYYSDPQSLENATGLFALNSDVVRSFAEQNLLLPVTILPQDRTYLADALERSTFNGQLFAFPWRREFCTFNYVNLAISAQLPSNVAVVANNLRDFLTRETNQRSNFEAWQIYPTLSKFYDGQTKFPEVSCRAVDAAAVNQAPSLFAEFEKEFGVTINFSLAKGLDSAQISDVAGQLVGIIVPVSDKNQANYMGRTIEGVFYIDNSLLTFETMVLLNKGIQQYPLLPAGPYMLACMDLPGSKDCLAVSQTREEFQINPDVILIESDLQVQANIPYARYEQGSHKMCFGNKKTRICIRGWHKK